MLRETILWMILQVAVCQENSGTRIFGIGYGSFLIIVSIIVAVIILVFAQSTTRPEVYSVLALLLPLFFILFFVFMPKQSQRQTTTVETDTSFVPHIIFSILLVLMLMVALVSYLLDKMMVYKRAKNIARSGVVYTEREEEIQTLRRDQDEEDSSQIQLI